MRIGYVRVSSAGQNTLRQEVLMQELGVERVFVDVASGKNAERPQLKEMMDFVREGDVVTVSDISRFARNTRDLLDLVEKLTQKGVEFVSKKECIDTTTATGKFMLTVFGAVATLERESILSRQAEGIACAKAQGRYLGRKKIEHNDFAGVYAQWTAKAITAVRAMDLLGMKPNTFYRRVKEFQAAQG
jgi:DNA invertase Pin-like site-specific DNA recombinase